MATHATALQMPDAQTRPAQQSDVNEHAKRVGLHDIELHTPPTHDPLQQLAVDVQPKPTPRHVALRQVPPEQVPAQQSPLAAQAPPEPAQGVAHTPAEHAPEQQADDVVQVPPLAVHAVVRQVPPEHRRPAQQAVPPTAHATPALRQTGGVAQRPDSQVSPAQHSVDRVHAPAAATQERAQRPLTQRVPAQQSPSAVQEEASARHTQ